MSKQSFFISLTIIFVIAFSFSSMVLAEETNIIDESIITAENLEEIVDKAIADAEDIVLAPAEELEGIEINELTKIPSAFGLFWKNIKENVSLAFTFNEEKKTELQLKFAEERIKLAELITESSDSSEMQEKATAMIKKAKQYMEKIMTKKEKFIEKTDDRTTKLLKNISKHELNKERVLEKIEDKIPVEKLEQFQAFRQEIEQKAKTFFDDIESNENISDELKELIIEKQQLIKNKIQEREEVRNGHQELLEEALSGNDKAKVELQTLRTETLEQRKETTDNMQLLKQELLDKLTSGDEKLKTAALEQLKKLKASTTMIQNQLKAEVKNMIRTRNEIKQNDSGNSDEASRVRAENQNKIERAEKLIDMVMPAKNQTGQNE